MTTTTTDNAMINGVDVEAVGCLISDVQADHRKGVAGFRARTVWKGALANTSYIDGWTLGGEEHPHDFKIDIDEPCALAGADQSPNPQEVLFSALNACMLNTFVAYASVKGIELESVEVVSEGELDLRGFLSIDANVNPGYDDVSYTFKVKGDATREQFEEIAELVRKASPNFANFARAITMKPNLVIE